VRPSLIVQVMLPVALGVSKRHSNFRACSTANVARRRSGLRLRRRLRGENGGRRTPERDEGEHSARDQQHDEHAAVCQMRARSVTVPSVVFGTSQRSLCSSVLDRPVAARATPGMAASASARWFPPRRSIEGFPDSGLLPERPFSRASRNSAAV